MNVRALAALSLGIGISPLCHAQALLQFQVSRALQENWGSSIDAAPGDSIDIRLLISYTGTHTPNGLGSVFYQPAISNWDSSGAHVDTLLPFVDHGGAGTVPLGDVPDAPGVYGRVAPFGWRAPTDGVGPNPYTRFINNVSGVNYLRIAQGGYSDWVGQGGNTEGGAGLNAGQPPEGYIAETPTYPHPFDHDISNLIVLKLGVTLSQDTDVRTLVFSTAEAFAGLAPNIETEVKWYSSSSDQFPGSLHGPATYQGATINIVPAPAPLAVLAAVLCIRRRRARA
jgi:hypothetical protein